jgi:hypothetical protein
MTKHEFLIWAVPLFTLTTILGAALSIMRLLSKRSTQQPETYGYPHSGDSSPLALQSSGRLLEKGAAFVYIIAALALVLAVSGSLVEWVHQ